MNIFRLIKALLIGFTGLFVVLTLFSLLIPSTVKLSRATVINKASAPEVYNLLADLRNWKNWHPVFKSDSAVIKYSSGKDCVIHYNGISSRLRITSVDSNSIKFFVATASETDILNELGITSLPNQDAVQVEWRVINKLRWYPWEKLYGIFLDNISGPGYELALNELKVFFESNRSR